MTSEISIEELSPDDTPAALRMLARAFRDSPATVSMYGEKPLHRFVSIHRAFAGWVPAMTDPPPVVARCGEIVVGACAFAPPGRCIAVAAGRVRSAEGPPEGRSPEEWERMKAWLFAWADHDPAGEHWHLGPVGVEPGFQGMGIGSAMLERFCARMDAAGTMSWLETDKPQNVTLYERHGYEVVDETDILGTHNWWMRRPSR